MCQMRDERSNQILYPIGSMNSILFSVMLTIFIVYQDLKQKKNPKGVLMSRSMHLHIEIYPNLKNISELFKMCMKNLDS